MIIRTVDTMDLIGSSRADVKTNLRSEETMREKLSGIGGVLLLCLVVFILTFPAATVRAQTIVFDNFGPGDTYNTSNSFLCANDGAWQSAWAFQFVPTSSGHVSDIWLPVNLFDGGTANNLEIALMTDSGNDQPGEVLETWTFNVSTKTFSGSIVHGTGTGTTAISEGVKYWLAGTVPSGTTSVVDWYWTPNDETENFILKESIGFAGWGSPSTGSRAAFRIAVNNGPPQAVPSMAEWGMIIFIALAGLGSVYFLRRQKTVGN